MILDPPFVTKKVQAGQPVTAQAWNEIVVAVGAISDFIEASAAASVKVQVTAQDADLSTVRVTATSSSGISTEAVRPIPPEKVHTFHGLLPDSYTIRAEAPGFDPATITVAVPATGVPQPQSITLTKHGSFMPLLFGTKLGEALTLLDQAHISVDEILDVTGVSVPVKKPGTAFTEEFVLMQHPVVGVPIATNESAKLLISAALRPETTIEMPALVGLTLGEVNQALEAAGLKLGRVTVLGRQSQPQTQPTNPTGPGGGTPNPVSNL